VRSPVVVAMWKPMAEALGWPDKPIGWDDLRKLAVAPTGWGAVGHKEWGPFKFGHTHPEYSNSGLIAVFAQIYAATGKDDDLTVKDVEEPRVAHYLAELQKAIVHYGSSTGFFGEKMFANGEDYLSAAILYENMVVESYGDKYKGKLKYPVVAVYPREGTFWSDHPVGILDRAWVGQAEQEAAELYIDFLLQEPQQRKALTYGFRPGLEKLKVESPIDRAHGVDPKQPEKILATPSVEVMRACLKVWQLNKKSARVLLVLDKSGSMNEQNKLKNALLGAKEIVAQLHDEDSLALLTFNHELELLDRGTRLKWGREHLNEVIDSIKAQGETSLYDAVAFSHRHLQSWFDPEVICAVVVLTDGEDTSSQMKLQELLTRLKQDKRRHSIKIYTIAYGEDANEKILKDIAEATQGRSYKGTPQNIRAIIKEIATFF
jgi:Ca-activated chloride channel family protein